MQPPYALLRASINGGAVQTGGLTIAGGAVVQLSADPAGASGITQYRWEIYDYPSGFGLPSGWTATSIGVYYATGATPPPFTVASAASFGKYMLRLTANGGISPSPIVLPPTQLVDESTILEVVGLSGMHGIGLNEGAQFSTLKQWLFHLVADLKLIDSFINTGGSGGTGVTVHGALTGLSADDHTQYVLVSGTRAMTGALAMGSHKITGLTDPTSPQDAATKAYVDANAGGGGILPNGTVAFTADQTLAGHKLTNLANPTAASDAATKAYVDASIVAPTTAILPNGTVAFTAAQSMGSNKLTNVATPTVGTDATNKTYVDTAISGITTVVSILPTGTVPFTAAQSMGGFGLNNLAAPSVSTDAATKGYVDTNITTLRIPVVHLATTAALPTNARTGNVLTASANGALTVDGTAVALNDRVLARNEATGANNGIYAVTATGGSGAAYQLTRTADTLVSGMLIAITAGTANGGKLSILATEGAIVVNTTALAFPITGAGGGTNGVDAFNVIPSSAPLTGGTQTVAPGTPGMKFTLPDSSMTANAVLTLVPGSGLRAFDVVFVECFDISAFTYTIHNGGATPADMITKPATPGCKRIYSFQWDGADFFPCNAVAVL